MSNLDKVAIVLHGFAVSVDQLKHLASYYKRRGFSNIVYSGYKNFVDDDLSGMVDVLYNDDPELGSFVYVSEVSQHRGIFGEEIRVYSDHEIPKIPGSNTNFHILTSIRGINYAIEKFPNIEYVLKLRADQRLEKLDLFVDKWIEQTKLTESSAKEEKVFENKLLTLGWSKMGQKIPWYISDYWTFGHKNDLKKYFSIPYNTDKNLVGGETYISRKYVSMQQPNPDFIKTLKKYWTFDNTIRNYSYKWKRYVNEFSSCILQEKDI